MSVVVITQHVKYKMTINREESGGVGEKSNMYFSPEDQLERASCIRVGHISPDQQFGEPG